MKSSLEGFKSRSEQTEERISNLEDRTSIEFEEQKGNRLRKSEQSLRQSRPTIMQTNIHIMGVPENI